MRGSLLSLPLLAAVAVAKESIHGHHDHAHHAICRSQLLPGQQQPLGVGDEPSPNCGPESLMAQIQEQPEAPEDKVWTHVGPCARNGTEEFCVFSNANFADGRGVSFITRRKTAAHIARSAAFRVEGTVKYSNQENNPNFEVVPVPGKDMGAVATRFFNRGDFIMSNTVSAMVDYDAFEALDIDAIKELQGKGIDYLPIKHRTQFLNLSTHTVTKTYLDKVERIFATNAFDIDLDDADTSNFYAMFPDISRMNHDCRPNADYHFDPTTMTQYVHAIRPIAKGEEITISYIDPFQPRATRLEKLHKTWGFHCGCSACQQTAAIAAASDARLAQIAELRKEFTDFSPQSRATPQMAELLISLYEQERTYSLMYEAHTYAAIEWNGVGEPWLAMKHARLAIEMGLASAGSKDRDVKEMEQLVKDPWGHWSWMLRTSRRMGWGKQQDQVNTKDDDDDDDD